MAQPVAYVPATSFVTYQATQPWFPGQNIDVELNALKATTDQIRGNLALIQRDDGALANGSVTFDSLSPTLQSAGLAPVSAWVTGHAYSVPQVVTQGNKVYQCAIAHTSGTFATDLAAGDWTQLADFSLGGGAVGPGTTVVGDFATWNNTLGTSLADTTPTQATALLNTFTSALKGLVPASGGGTTNFLRADGSFAAPPASPPSAPSRSVQYNNAGAFGGITNLTTDGTNVTAHRNKSTASLDWDNGSGTVDLSLFRDGAGALDLRVGTAAQTLRVYNTFTDASNHERGVFDWSTTTNTLTIGTQNAGTGVTRNLQFIVGGTNQLDYGITNSGIWSFSGSAHFGGGILLAGNYPGQGGLVVAQGGVNSVLLQSTANIGMQLNNACGVGWVSSNDAVSGSVDTRLYRNVAGVVEINTGTPGALAGTYLHWGGQARVTADFSVMSSITLANITGLSVNVAAGRTYSFEAVLHCTDATAGGVAAAISGTCTATNIVYDGFMLDGNSITNHVQATALGTLVAAGTTSGTTPLIVIKGTITVNAAGTLTVQFAQAVSSGTASVAKRGSRFIVHDMP